MLFVYFTASTSANGEYASSYKRIISLLEKESSVMLLSGKQIVSPKLKSKDALTKAEVIFKREKRLLEQADCVIAEVSKPSTGVGGEIVYALTHNIPVLGLLKTGSEDVISPMVKGNPSELLFLETYSDSNLSYVISDFISHVKHMRSKKGKLIVIDGADASGKTTQAELILDYLKEKHIPTKYVDFPQYHKTFHGKVVARFLQGEFGELDSVSPYLISLAYAIDRASLKREMDDFLNKGGCIIANRYATSNMAHQSAKFATKHEQEAYLKWEYELEYKVHKIPKEDLVIYLHVPWQISKKLAEKREKPSYLKGAKDITEKSLQHQITSEQMYLTLTKRYPHWKKIDCVENGVLLSREAIYEKIVKIVDTYI